MENNNCFERIQINYSTSFGDEVRFETNMASPATVSDMMVVFCRFLLGAGWSWDNVKEFHPDYMYEKIENFYFDKKESEEET